MTDPICKVDIIYTGIKGIEIESKSSTSISAESFNQV